jgi:hypothetical protein
MSLSIHSFFKPTEKTKNNNDDDNGPSSSNIVNKTVNRSNHVNIVERPTEKPSLYQPPENFVFPKTLIGKKRERHCQSQWFKIFPWLHYDVEKDAVFCHFCTLHEDKLLAEHNKDPAYISTGFKNWKKAPKCFKAHESSNCHKAALTNQVTVPKCGDVAELINKDLQKQRFDERQYLKVVMECLQFLGRQGIALRGNEDGNDNLTQLLLLRGKDHPRVIQRIQSKESSKKRYTHHDYQDELLQIMANQVLRKKLREVKKSNFYAIMCDEYTDISNKEQLSICVRWVDDNLEAHEDFLGYYQIPNIKSDTIVSAIKDALTRFELPLTNLRGQTYDGASNMMGHKSGVAKKIREIQPKALETHCHGHTLSLSVKDMTNQSKLLSDVIGTVGEITVLVKYSPKREQLLGSIQSNLECADNDDSFEQPTSLSKLCVTRWTVRATTYMKVLTNYDSLMKLWDVSLQSSLDRETRARIIGCQAQMTTFDFFYGLNLAHRLYAMTDNLSKTIQKESFSAIDGQRCADLTLQTLKGMRTDEAAKLFYNAIVKKETKHEFIESAHLPRKRKRPNYKTVQQHFQIDGYKEGTEAHHPATPEDHYRSIYLDSLDVITSSIKTRFEQPSFGAFLKLESFILQSINDPSIDDEVVTFLRDTYSEDLDVDALIVEGAVLKTMLKDSEFKCFRDVYKRVKTYNCEKNLIPNMVKLIELLLVNPATSCTPERSFSTARRLKTWLRSTMTNKRFNFLSILNIHKDKTDKLDLVDIGNEFVSLYESRHQCFGTFEASDF